MRRLLFISFLGLFLPLYSLFGQCEQTTQGTEFWVGFMHHSEANDAQLSLFITSAFTTSGQIFVGTNPPINFNVAANTSQRIDLNRADAENVLSQQITQQGIRVVSNDPISLYALNQKDFSADATVVYPATTLGTNYFVMSQRPPDANAARYKSEFLIVGTENNTVIEITPSQGTEQGNSSGVPFNINLDRGETYQVKAASRFGATGDLTGTKVTANKRIALFSGNFRTRIPSNTCCYDHLYYQMPPVSVLGRDYITTPLRYANGPVNTPLRSYDVFRVLSVRDNTTINFANNTPATITLNEGDFYEFTTQGNNIPEVISASEPIMVAQFSGGRDIDGITDADPFMIMLNPNSQTVNSITFDAFNIAGVNDYLVNVLALTSEIPSIQLDGNPVNPVSFTPIPTTLYSYGRLRVTGGSHNITGDPNGEGFAIYIYGYGSAKSFGYSAGGSLTPVLDLGEDKQVCGAGSIVTLDAGQFTNYLWSTGETTPQITVSQAGTYTVTGTNDFGCTATDEIIVTESVLPITDIKVSRQMLDSVWLCPSSNTISLDVNDPSHDTDFIYSWSTGQTAATFSTSPNITNQTITVEVTDPDNDPICAEVGRDTLQVFLVPDPVAEIQVTQGVSRTSDVLYYCNSEGDQTIFANTIANHSTTEYEWYDLNGALVSTGTSLTVAAAVDSLTFILDTKNPLTLNPCEARDTISLVFLPEVRIAYDGSTATDSIFLCQGTPTELFSVEYLSGSGTNTLDLDFLWTRLDLNDTLSTADTVQLAIPAGRPTIELSFTHSSGALGCGPRDTVQVIFFTELPAEIQFTPGVTRTTDVLFTCTNQNQAIIYADTAGNPSVYQYTWSNFSDGTPLGSGGSLNIPITAPDSVTYLLTVSSPTAVSGCDFFDTASVVFLPEVAINYEGSLAPDTLLLCEGEAPTTAQLSFPDGDGGLALIPEWRWLETNTIISNSASADLSSLTQTARVELTIRHPNGILGCESRDTLTIDFFSPSSTQITQGGGQPDTIRLCRDELPITFGFNSAVSNYNLTWQSLSGATLDTNDILSVDNFTGTQNIVLAFQELETTAQCFTFDTVTVISNVIPTAGLPDTVFVCNSVGTITAQGGGQEYLWTFPDNSVGQDRSFTPPLEGYYTVIIENPNTGCQGRDTTFASFEENPDVRIAYDTAQQLCYDNTIRLTAILDNAQNGLVLFTWGTGEIQESIFASDTGSVTFSVTAQNQRTGCQNTTQETITFSPFPTLNLPTQESFCNTGDTLGRFLPDNPEIEYTWTFNGVNQTGRLIFADQAGTYEIEARNIRTGCTSTGSLLLVINEPPLLEIPDRIELCDNDTAILIGRDLSNNQNTIYLWTNLATGDSLSNQGVLAQDSSGTYAVTVTDSRTGCSVRDTTELEFFPQPEFTISGYEGAICDRNDTLIVNADELSAYEILWSPSRSTETNLIVERSGVYSVTLTDPRSSARCSTTKVRSVEINRSPVLPQIPEENTICPDEILTIDGSDVSHTVNVQYRWTRLEDGGVVGTNAFLRLAHGGTVQEAAYELEVSSGQCAQSLTFTVNFLPERVTAEAIISDTTICLGEEITLSTASTQSILWSTGATETSITFTPETTGTQIYTLTTLGACTSSQDTVSVLVSNVPNLTLTQSQAEACLGDSILLDGFDFSDGNTTLYNWRRLDTDSTISTSSRTFFSATTVDTFLIALEKRDSLGSCTVRDTAQLVFNELPSVTATISDSAICLGESAVLTAAGNGTLLWDDGQTDTQITWTPDRVGRQTRVVSSENGCGQVQDTLEVQVFAFPEVTITPQATSDLTICEGEEITLTATTNATETRWEGDTSAVSQEAFTLIPATSRWVKVNVSNANGCTVSDSVWVTVLPGIGDYPTSYEACEGEALLLGTPVTDATYNWTTLQQGTPQVRVRESGDYPVRITRGSCVFDVTVRADFQPNPVFSLPTDTTFCADSTLTIFPITPEDTLDIFVEAQFSYKWTDERNNLLSEELELTLQRSGTYRLTLAANYKIAVCEDFSEIRVAEYCEPQLAVPNAFTPNNDGLNQRFRIFGNGDFRAFQMRIYNRWGEPVFELKNEVGLPQDEQSWWDGGDLPNGIYPWVIEYTEIIDGEPVLRRQEGSVSLIR